MAGFLISGGVWCEMDGSGGGMGLLRTQLVNSYQSLEISVNCSRWLVAGAFLISHEIKLR